MTGDSFIVNILPTMADLPNLKNPAIKPAVRTENNDFHEIQNVNLDLTNINMNGLLSDFGGQEFICTQLLISDLQPVGSKIDSLPYTILKIDDGSLPEKHNCVIF